MGREMALDEEERQLLIEALDMLENESVGRRRDVEELRERLKKEER